MTEPESTDRLALEPARIDWGADGVPRARGFDDLYYAASDGLAESRHVFLDQNDLPARFAALNAGDDFVIGETGFGTGLNFLAAWRLWRERAPAQATLHFLSVEGHPLASADLARALGGWDDLAEESKLLVDAYPTCLARGLHLLKFDQGRVRLVVAFDEAVRGLEAFLESGHPLHAAPRRGVDAWFLDGFAPARNPAMWRPELFELLRSVSAPGASFATFTAAGDVRRGLQDAGFTVEKAPGFGRKRDMLKGRLAAPAPRPGAEAFPASPYPDGHPHAWPVNADPVPAAPGARVAVVGGGLAGCHAASALAERGFTVTLLEAETTLATGGSGNAQGVLYARPSPAGGLAARFNLLALLFAQRHYRKFWNDASHRFGESCGVLHVAVNARDRERQAALAADLGDTALCHRLDAAAAAKQAGIPLGEGGLWFPRSGWLNPPAICRALVDSASVTVKTARVERLSRDGSGVWTLQDDAGRACAEAEFVVLACASTLDRFSLTGELPVQPVRGQVSTLAGRRLPAATGLRLALCADGYVVPAPDGGLCFGASFVPDDTSTRRRAEEDEENLARLRARFPALVDGDVTVEDCEARAALRCATPDRLPMVGPAPDMDVMKERFALLRKNANAAIAAPGAWHPGLFVSAGYGSRGLAYIPLATELLVSQISGTPPPLDGDLRAALSPARFVVRDLVRNRA